MADPYWHGAKSLLLHPDSGLLDDTLRNEVATLCQLWESGEYEKEAAAQGKALHRLQEILNQHQEDLYEQMETLSVGEQGDNTGEGERSLGSTETSKRKRGQGDVAGPSKIKKLRIIMNPKVAQLSYDQAAAAVLRIHNLLSGGVLPEHLSPNPAPPPVEEDSESEEELPKQQEDIPVDHEGALKILDQPQRKKKEMSALDKMLARDDEAEDTVTAQINRLNVIPRHIRAALGTDTIKLPLGMFLPGYELGRIRPPGDDDKNSIEITERETSAEGIMRQKETAISFGIDTSKGYFVGMVKAFGKKLRKMEEVDREKLPQKLADQLTRWERETVQAAGAGDVVSKWVLEELLGYIVFLTDGNTRLKGWVLAFLEELGRVGSVRKAPMVPVKLVEPTVDNYEEFLVISHQINVGEAASITKSTPVQRLLNLHKFNRMSIEAVKACVSVKTMRTIYEELGIKIEPKEKKERKKPLKKGKGKEKTEEVEMEEIKKGGIRLPILLYALLERPNLRKQLLGLTNGYDLKDEKREKLLDRAWEKVERKQAAEEEKKKMQKLLSACGLAKIDPLTGKNYWEEEMREWVVNKELSYELKNAEILTSLKEAALPMFWDKQVFAVMRLMNDVLKKRGLQKTREVLEPWISSLKIFWKATDRALEWMEEMGIMVKEKERKAGSGGVWKGEWKKLMKGKISWWQYVLEIMHAEYNKVDEHPFVWLAKLGRKRVFPKQLEEGERNPLDGVWRRLIIG